MDNQVDKQILGGGEDNLNDREQQLNQIVLHLPVPISITKKADMSIVFANDAAEKLLGYQQGEMIGMTADQFIADLNQGEKMLSQLMRDGHVDRFELKYRRRDGSIIWVTQSINLIDYFGEPAFLSCAYDTTTKRDLAEALSSAKENAEKARIEAERTDRAQGEFLANISHEIRTPMNGIIGMTSLLADTELNREQRGFLETIRSSSDTLLTVINDVLDYSKIEAGKLEVENKPLDLVHVLQECVNLITPEANDKGLQLKLNVDASVPQWISGDVSRIRQIVTKLIANALKFTDTGEITVAATARLVDTADYEGLQHEVDISVKDTGIGIAHEELDQLFKSFSQIDSSSTRRFGGAGLGLAICKQLSELMGGTISVESEVGRGSTFHFIFVGEVAVPDVEPAEVSADFLRKKRALIVDDNETSRNIIAHHCLRWGMQTEIVTSGSAGLNLLSIVENHYYDVILLSHEMSEMNGLQMIEGVLDFGRPLPPTILITSSSDPGLHLQAEEMGINLCITRPIQFNALHGALLTLFAKSLLKQQERGGRVKIDKTLAQHYPLRILLAEDNVINQKVALRTLERLGYFADLAANGQEAVTAVMRRPYDLVLMDVHMPQMDGILATKEIYRLVPAEERPFIVALTAGAMQKDQDRCLAAGMEQVMIKPFRVNELVEVLRSIRGLVDQRESEKEAASIF